MRRLLQDNVQHLKRQVIAQTLKIDELLWFQKYKEFSAGQSHHVLLESGRGGRYSFIGVSPIAILQGKDNRLTVISDQDTFSEEGDLLELMRKWMATFQIQTIENGPPFQGGAIGYLSYDIVRQFEKLDELARDDLQTDDLYFLVFQDVFAYDHQENLLWILTHDENESLSRRRLATYKKQWQTPIELTKKQSGNIKIDDNLETSFTNEEFQIAVRKVQDYIANGDVFQVNLSVRQSQRLQTDPLHIYEKLREINPSPYMSYFHTPDIQLVSASPELLVKKKGDEVSTRPIAGTRSRGKDDAEDDYLAKTLIENEKERAEHIMLVDLERNDLGRVCQYGSVEVNELMVIEKYSHVMHIVSNVRGILDSKYDTYDIIRATFPGGTITGAPKVRTMEIIEELEPVRRGVYTGSIGWIGFDGDMELNITIRTLLAKGAMAYVQAGAGIVIDSDPEAEFKESLKKGMALWRAKEMSEEELSKEKARMS